MKTRFIFFFIFSFAFFSFAEEYNLYLVVKDNEGTRVDNAKVELIDYKNSDIVFLKKTDKSGKAVFSRLKKGVYILVCKKFGYENLSEAVAIEKNTRKLIVLNKDISSAPIDIIKISKKKSNVIKKEKSQKNIKPESKNIPKKDKNQSIETENSGTILFGKIAYLEDGIVIQGARVLLDGNEAHTNNSGFYTLTNVIPGKHILEIYLKNMLLYTDSIHVGQKKLRYDILIPQKN